MASAWMRPASSSASAALMARWRWPVLLLWLLVLGVAGALLAPNAPGVLKAGGFALEANGATRIVPQNRKFRFPK